MGIDSILGILLHTGIDCGINLQTILVDVIVTSILVLVLIAPTIERILLPSDRIDNELDLLPRLILGAYRLCSSHISAQILTKIGSRTFLVVSTLEIELNRLLGILLIVGVCDIAFLTHLRENNITTLKASVLMTHRIEV